MYHFTNVKRHRRCDQINFRSYFFHFFRNSDFKLLHSYYISISARLMSIDGITMSNMYVVREIKKNVKLESLKFESLNFESFSSKKS